MEISEIKSRLSLQTVLAHYQIKLDSNHRTLCLWHDDKTPSLQIYPETNTWTCFSTNCTAGSGDVIDFIMRMEDCSKHEAIQKAKSMIGVSIIQTTSKKMAAKLVKGQTGYDKLFTQFRSNIKSEKVKAYLVQRNLDRTKVEIGYNANAWAHLKHCIIFPLRNPNHEIVSFYGRSIYDKPDSKPASPAGRHFYLKNRSGLYPGYPKPGTKTLILTEAVIDAASLTQLDLSEEILALYGTNGLTEEHQRAIKQLANLEEVIFFFDGDQAGHKAIEKWTPVLRELQPEVRISYVQTPEGEDINSLSQTHELEIFHHLIEQRQRIPQQQDLVPKADKYFLSIENSSIEKEKTDARGRYIKLTNPFDSSNPKNLHYRGKAAQYYIKGTIKGGLESMKVSIQILNDRGEDYRSKLDLYEYKQVGAVAKLAAQKLSVSEEQIEKDLTKLTRYLEQWRQEEEQQKQALKASVTVPVETSLKCTEFLRKSGLLKAINELIGRSGIIGEDQGRIFLFVIASSYKMEDTLHALVQGSSGSGKTHLIIKISELMPLEDTITLTRITESSLYNYGEYELQNKLIILEDLDGLKEEAFLAFRELQSRGILASSTSIKNEEGNIRSAIRTVRGPITSLSATTHGEVYEDNMSRCFLVAVDESKEQTDRIIDYHNRIFRGEQGKSERQKIKHFLQNCIRLLKPHDVVNPYAGKIHLPREAHKVRRLEELFRYFIKQVTLLHQYQREKDKQGRLITTKEDLRNAIEIMFESIVLKVDELDGSLRQFFEQLKEHLKNKDTDFGQREIRQALRISKTQLHRYIQDLIALEYIQQTGGSPNRGYTYKISYWDNIERLRNRIKDDLNDQLDKL